MATRVILAFGSLALFGTRRLLPFLLIFAAAAAQARAEEAADCVQHTRPKKDICGPFVPVHHQENEAAGHQNERNSGDNLAAERVSVLTSELPVDRLDDQHREIFANAFVKLKDFRA
jgi:hypothetical protein